MATESILEAVEGIVHEETQVHERGVDLTLAEVYRIDEPGRVDFGGGELEEPGLSAHERVWRNRDDDYQWWDLEGGQYLIEHNERLAPSAPLVLQTREALLARGAFHPTLSVERLDVVPLAVPPGGVRLKENARVSTLLPADPV